MSNRIWKKILDPNHTFVIAEVGVNHNGSVEIAKQLVDIAAAAGADAVKFQTLNAEKYISKHAEKAKYQKKTTDVKESQLDMIKKLKLGPRAHKELIAYCLRKDIQFLSTPFDKTAADFLEELGVPVFKIGSGEITNTPFLEYVARKKKPIILSTGMSNIGEVEKALEAIYTGGNNNVVLLHCVSEYPAPVEQINLRAMETMKRAFQIPVGYSDHTTGIEVAIAAVALGACLIEKHLTLDRNMKGPDHMASIEPEELKCMLRSIRNVEKALGTAIKKPADCEIPNIDTIRKKLVFARNVKKGTKLSTYDISIKRAERGIVPSQLRLVLGKTLRKDEEKDSPVTWNKI